MDISILCCFFEAIFKGLIPITIFLISSIMCYNGQSEWFFCVGIICVSEMLLLISICQRRPGVHFSWRNIGNAKLM